MGSLIAYPSTTNFDNAQRPQNRTRDSRVSAWTLGVEGKLGARDRVRTGDPHVGKEMLASISLRNFDRSGHIGSFRSIVGEEGGGWRIWAGEPHKRHCSGAESCSFRGGRRDRNKSSAQWGTPCCPYELSTVLFHAVPSAIPDSSKTTWTDSLDPNDKELAQWHIEK